MNPASPALASPFPGFTHEKGRGLDVRGLEDCTRDQAAQLASVALASSTGSSAPNGNVTLSCLYFGRPVPAGIK